MLTSPFIVFLLYQFPAIILHIVGLIWTITCYKRLGNAGIVLILSMLVFLVGRAISIVIYSWSTAGHESFREYIAWVGIINTVSIFIGFALLITAVFVGRGKPDNQTH